MLVLSRKPGEQVVVSVPPSSEAQLVVVTLVEARDNRVRLGFKAERDVSVHRREVWEKIQGETSEGKEGR